MNISKKEVTHIASLSRLKLSQKETEIFSRELTEIFGYIDKLKELKGSEITFNPKKAGNTTRLDEKRDFKGQDKILKNAPKVINNFIEVRGVFK